MQRDLDAMRQCSSSFMMVFWGCCSCFLGDLLAFASGVGTTPGLELNGIDHNLQRAGSNLNAATAAIADTCFGNVSVGFFAMRARL